MQQVTRATITEDLKGVKDDIRTIKEEQTTLAERVKQLEDNSKKTGSESGSTAGSFWFGSSGGSTRDGPSLTAPTPTVNASDLPRPVLKIRNFCDFGSWRLSGVNREEAQELMDKLMAEVPTALRNEILPFELVGPLNFEVTVPLRRAGVVLELRRWWQDALQNKEELKFRDRKLYVVPERSPQEKPMYRAMGKMKETLQSFMERAMVDSSIELQGFWSPAWKFNIKENGKEWPICSLNSKGIWVWDERNLKHYVKVDSKEVLQEI